MFSRNNLLKEQHICVIIHVTNENKNKIQNSTVLESLELSKIKGNNISMTAKFLLQI